MKVSELFEEEVIVINLTNKKLSSFDQQSIPAKVTSFLCQDNQLTSLVGGPKEVMQDYNCNRNKQYLTSLEGCPSKIGNILYCETNNISSLQGIHKLFKGGWIKEEFHLSGNPIKSHILGLLLIPQLREVSYVNKVNRDCYDAFKIINRHLKGDRDVIDCQQELIEAGLKEFAQL